MKKSSVLINFAASLTAAVLCLSLSVCVFADAQAETSWETAAYSPETDPNYLEFVRWLKDNNIADSKENIFFNVQLSPSEYGYAPVVQVDKYGNIIDDKNIYSSRLSKAADSSLPSKYDSRDYGYITSVKDQGEANNCWAFAFTALSEASMVKDKVADIDVDLSESHIVWFTNRSGAAKDENDTTKGDGYIYDSPYKQGGNPGTAALSVMSGRGAELDIYAPFYNTESEFSKMTYDDDAQRYISEYRIKNIYEYDSNDLNDVKRGIMEHGAVSRSYFHDYSALNSSTNAYYSTSTSGGHAVALIGWDDDYPKENFKTRPNSDGAWLVKNSWGPSWGDKGFFWMSYETVLNGSEGIAVDYFDNKDVFDNIYQYNGSFNGVFYTGQEGFTLSYGNIFTAKNDELVKGAISPFVAGAAYEIKVYTCLTNASDPTSGTLKVKKTFTADRTGEYTVLFDETPVSAGEKFSVVLSVDTGDAVGAHFQIFEGTTNKATYPGVSFINYYSRNWQESTFGNVTVKAVTSNTDASNTKLREEYKTELKTIYDKYDIISFASAGGSTVSYPNNNRRGFMAAKNAAETLLADEAASVTDIKNCIKRLSYFGEKILSDGVIIINTADELSDLAAKVNSGDNYSGKTIFLKADIDMQGKSFTPIGSTTSTPFSGTFCGGGHYIKHISYNGTYAGLFGAVSGGSISDLCVRESDLTGSSACGAIAGYVSSSSQIINCSSINNSINITAGYGGGILGRTSGSNEISSCFVSSAQIASSGRSGNIGVISGYNSSGISDCDYTEVTSSGSAVLKTNGTNAETKTGDVDRSGEFNMLDVVAAKGKTYESTDFASVLADADNNGVIDDADTAKLLKELFKIE